MPKKGQGGKRKTPIRNPVARQQDKAMMMMMLRRGYTVRDVAEKLGIGEMQVYRDFNATITEITQHRNKNTEELVTIAVEQYKEVMKEAWEAWERSKDDAKKLQEEEDSVRICVICMGTGKKPVRRKEVDEDIDDDEDGTPKAFRKNRKPKKSERVDTHSDEPCFYCNGTGKRLPKVIRTTEGKIGNNEYLRTIKQCIDALCELQGLYPDKKLQVTGSIINWDVLAQGIPDGPIPDYIETEIHNALSYDPRVAIVANLDNQEKKEDLEGETVIIDGIAEEVVLGCEEAMIEEHLQNIEEMKRVVLPTTRDGV